MSGMNRRSFFRFLAATPVAAAVGLKVKAEIEPMYEHKAVGHTFLVHPNHEKQVREIMMDNGPAATPSFDSVWKMIDEFERNSR